ncbi:MAG: hypothetical protein Q7N87_02660 [Candidatus Uhrbacteria bacterium]|nr:hypothetical protein [Candidatus Uhrbacteria bacterium]
MSVATSTTLSLGNQTATLTTFSNIFLGALTVTSTTNTRTVTNPASLYIEGAPVAGGNVTFTNGPYALWVAGGVSRFDGGILLNSSTSTITNLTWVNATGTNTTTTWLGYTTASGTTETVYNFTATNATSTWLGFTTASGTSVFATNGTYVGTTSSWLGFGTASGTTGNIINLTSSNATITGGSINGTTIGLTNASTGIFTDTTTTNATTTAFAFTSASGTTLRAINLTSSNATISGGTINGATIGATNASTGAFTTLSATSLATLSGGILVNNATSTITNLTTINVTSSNVTTTWLGYTTASGTTETVFNFTATNATSTWFGFTNTSGTSVFATNGTYVGTTSSWLGFTTASGTTGNIINLTSSNVTISGGTINGTTIGATNASTGAFTTLSATSLATLSGGILVNNATSTITNLTWVNATGTNTTTTALAFTSASGTTLRAINLTSSNVTVTGGTINGTTIGATDASSGVFTNVTATNLFVTNTTTTNLAVTGYLTAATTTVTGTLSLTTTAWTGGTPTLFTITGPTHTTLTAGTEALDVNMNLGRTVQFNTGNINTQRAVTISAPTYTFVATSTIGTAVTLDVGGPPAMGNATSNQAYGIRVNGGFTAATNSTAGILITPPQIQDGFIGNTSILTGLFVGTTTTLSLGNQAGTVTTLSDVHLLALTPTSAVARTVTNPATLYIEGAPIAGANITFTNGPYALFVDADLSRFDGGILVNNATSTITNLTTINVTSSNVTTTWLGYTTASGTTETVYNFTATNATSTWFGFTTASGTSVFATNGTYVGTTSSWLGFTTASGTTGNIINLTSSNVTITGGTINGTSIGTTTASSGAFSSISNTGLSTLSGGILANNATSTITNLTWVNATGTNTTTTWLGFTTASGTTLSAYNASSTHSTTTNFTVQNSITNQLSGASNFNTRSTTGLPSGGAPSGIFVSGRYAYVANTASSSLSVIDVSNPEAPTVVTSTYLGSGRVPTRVFVSGAYAYVVDAQTTGGLNIVDISTPASSTLVGTSASLNIPTDVFVSGRYAYISSDADLRLVVMDVSDPTNPFIVGTSGSTQQGRAVYVSGHHAYIAEDAVTPGSGGQVRAVDVNNPGIPIGRGTFALTVTSTAIFVQGSYAYVISSTDDTLRVINIQNPAIMTSAGTLNLTGGSTATSTSIFVSGRYAYVALSDNTVKVIDVNVPATMTEVKSYSLSGALGYAQGLFVSGRYLYASQGNGVNSFIVADVTGIDTNGLLAHTAEVGTLQVRGDGTIGNQLRVNGGLNIGMGGIYSVGALSINVTSSNPSAGGNAAAKFVNTAATGTGQTWGVYANSLLVGPSESATGSANWVSVFTYTSGTRGGLCLDATDVAGTCPVATTGLSLAADGTVASNNFDVAEKYDISGSASPGDVLVIDSTASSTAKMSSGISYDPNLMGVVSTQPGFLLGTGGGVSVALVGRVPVNVSPINGSIRIGDALTSSPYPGIAMKATKPGMILGRALQSASATSTIEVFLHVGYDAGSILTNDGSVAQITGDLVVASTSTASASNPTADSWGLTLRGSAWDGVQAVSSDFTLLTRVLTATSSQLTIRYSSTTLFSLNQNGTAAVSGDLMVGGKLYPSARGVAQNSAYLFVDDSQGPTSTYMATNAAGWQSDSGYDFAERYYSPDKLEPGDLVVVSQRGQIHVQRSWDAHQMLIGIVSTKPGFVAGRPATSTYPIALVGRVSTKVSTINGIIRAGDSLAPSTIPGVAVKATEPGPIVGQALQEFSGQDVGFIEVFVNPVWWGGGQVTGDSLQLTAGQVTGDRLQVVAQSLQLTASKSYQGFALVESGSKKVHVSFPSLQAYPNVQATPRGEVDGGWWTDYYTDIGFDILLKQAQTHDVTFAWRVEATQMDEQVSISDGTIASVDPMTGVIVRDTQTTSTAPIIEPSSTMSSTSFSTIISTSSSSTISEEPIPTDQVFVTSSSDTIVFTDTVLPAATSSSDVPDTSTSTQL